MLNLRSSGRDPEQTLARGYPEFMPIAGHQSMPRRTVAEELCCRATPATQFHAMAAALSRSGGHEAI
jgi:hypothetical protein